MQKLTLTLMLTGLALVLTATPVLKAFLPMVALQSAAAQNEPDGDNNNGGTDEGDGDNNDVDDGQL